MKLKKKLIIGAVIISTILILHFSGIGSFLTLEKFLENRELLLQAIKNNYAFSVFIFIAAYIGIVISSLPFAAFLNIVAGFLFNVIPGTIYSIIGSVIGCTISFLLFRYFFGESIQKKYSDKLQKFNKDIERYGAAYLLIIQLTGIFPFFLINGMAAVTKIPIKTFIWTTLIGLIPITLVYSYAGRQLGKIKSFSEIFSTKILLAFLFFALLGIISILLKKYKESKDLDKVA